MNLVPLSKEHPFRERLFALTERLNGQVDKVTALKQKIVDRLLAWQENIEATKLDGSGTFVTTGVRERLQSLIPEFIGEVIEINAHGWVNLHDGMESFHIGSIRVPWTDQWAHQKFVNRNCLQDLERMTFSPTDCLRYTDPRYATQDSVGSFQLNDDDVHAARIVMGADYVRGYVGIAQKIHAEEESGQYRDDRAIMNLEDAFKAIQWLENNVPPVSRSITSPHTPPLS